MNRPIFRKQDGENVVFDMVDDYGRTWSRGSGVSRTQAIGAARINQPPIDVRKSILLAAKRHPIKAALLTATAFHTYKAVHALRNEKAPPGLISFLIYTAVAFVGLKILSAFVSDEV